MAENTSTAKTWIIRILLIFIFIQVIKFCRDDPEPTVYKSPEPEASTSESSKVFRFNLTECLGKDLVKPATFTVDANSTEWVLDFNNGSSLTYTIISGNENDPLCGLKAKDSYGDRCTICIKKNESGSSTVTFGYSGKTLVYKGEYMK